jgi:hypothetical protein
MSTLKSAGADLISTCFADFDGSCNVEQVQYGSILSYYVLNIV